VILITGFSDPALACDDVPAGVDLVLGNQSHKKSCGWLSPSFPQHDRGSCSIAVTSGAA
jgi:hypothetical protein